ncbi:hypothetical protein OEZ85_006488 [Tetradesmus obliquus]|uniref:Choloylglycine hydrolase/NAAA C-terminal domain-containing protein n=1 Tax=Tetradesmus obliquus TaxID=3088 RepID=A0ABY8TUQ5_TETOB|nr:hypothetical protein OEZ85_006488 [Tetradesmus obliquus]
MAFSEQWGLSSGLLVVPPGGKLPVLQIAPGVQSSFGAQVEFLYGTTCLGHNFTEVIQVEKSPPIGMPTGNYFVCNQGMNDAGLVVGFHNHGQPKGSPNPPAYDPKSPKKQAINYFDMAAVTLARFRTCAEVKKAYNEDIQLVFGTDINPFRPGQWLAVYDATGAACVVQIKLGKVEVLDNKLGVLANMYFPTNDGYIVEQTQRYLDFVKAQGLTVDADGFINGPFRYYLPDGSTSAEPQPGWLFKAILANNFTNIVGAYNGDSRFARMAMLKSAAQLHCSITDGRLTPTSPGVAPKSYPKSWPSLLTVRQIIEAVALPRGMLDEGLIASTHNPAGPDAWKGDETLWVAMFDQTNKVMFYRTGNMVMYRMVNLNKINWSRVPTWPRVRFIRLLPTANPGVTDVTASLQAA